MKDILDYKVTKIKTLDCPYHWEVFKVNPPSQFNEKELIASGFSKTELDAYQMIFTLLKNN